jgi:cytochrome c-type biogenesis protein CcmE
MGKSQKQRLIFIVLGLGIAALALWFSIDAFRKEASAFQSPEEVAKTPPKERAGEQLRIGGLVNEGSVHTASDGGFYFVISDFQSEIKIYYKGLLPDLFREGQGVYVDGAFDDKGDIFIATEVLAKHDEKYTPPLPGEGIEENIE